jgi:L,D-transpeptidase ErfK/SrfK
MKKNLVWIGLYTCLSLILSPSTHAETFALPEQGDLIGQIQHTRVYQGESLGDIGRRFDMGVYEMIEANPGLDPWVPPVGAQVIVPSQFILPAGPRVGIVLNLAEMRLYYYHPDKRRVSTYPVGIGKKNWSSPLGSSSIVGKTKDPSWNPPPSIRAEHRRKGDILPAVVPAGPNNPLGRYALRLGFAGFLLHGTKQSRIGGIGVRSSHGCVRLFNKDIETLYHSVPVGTPVRFIHEPLKVGFQGGHLYLEAHEPLSDAKYRGCNSEAVLTRLIQRAVKDANQVDWRNVTNAARSARGYPIRIN